ncbi:hypothetical protein KM043_013023 [Ampulex compressa]|nr:hypothetical protein KM043_013023 [Ampulex compressa]
MRPHTSSRGQAHTDPGTCTDIFEEPVGVPVGIRGALMWMHRGTCATTRQDHCGCMMYIRHRVVQWRICKTSGVPLRGQTPPLPPAYAPVVPGPTRNRPINIEGSHK